jgi:hypothetical protein
MERATSQNQAYHAALLTDDAELLRKIESVIFSGDRA